MPSRVWSRGPDTLGVNGSFYGDYAFAAYAVTDDQQRVYFCQFPGFGSEQVFLRLDPPYTEWFTMWGFPAHYFTGPKGSSEFMELQAQGNGIVILGGSDTGNGGGRYDGDADLGEPSNDGSWGPWEPNPYQPTLFGDKTATWTTLIGGFNESGLQYFASAKDSTERIWFVENLGYDGSGNGNMAGYLDPDAIEPVRVADMQTGPSVEGFTACCDKSGRLIVAGPNDLSGDVWRYTPGLLVAAGVHEIQRVEIVIAAGVTLVTPPAILNLDNEAVDPTENLAATQAHYDHNMGAGQVTLSGVDGSDHTVTWNDPGARSELNAPVGDPNVTITLVQRGTGYPTADTWESLDPLPAAISRGVLIADGLSPEGIHYIGGDASLNPVATHYRWREGSGWQQLNDLPDGLCTCSIVGTSAESRPAFLRDGLIIVFAYSLDSMQTAVLSFDLANDRWGAPVYTEVNHQRGGFTLTDTHAIIIGGTDDGGDPTSAVERIRVADLAAFGGLHLAALSWRSEA